MNFPIGISFVGLSRSDGIPIKEHERKMI